MKKLILISFLFTIFLQNSEAQFINNMTDSRRRNMFGRELFIYRMYNMADSTDFSKSRVDFYFGVLNDILTFYKKDKGYEARYEISAIVYDDKEAIAERSVAGRINVQDYDETNLRSDPSRHSFSISLDPGDYKVLVKITDSESGEAIEKEEQLNLKDFSDKKLHIGDPVFTDSINCSSTKPVYRPNLANSFNDINSDFAVYVEMYPPQNSAKMKTDFIVHNSEGEKLFLSPKEYTLDNDSQIIRECINLRDYLSQPGEYYLNINAQAGKHKESIRRAFHVFWGNLEMRDNNLTIAIEQLALVGNKKTIDSMRNAAEKQKKVLFDRFWERRDPTPETRTNELKLEFYRRVDFSNKNFTEISSRRPGWRTDRGRIYIKYGPPSDVSRHDMEMNMPATEVWNYDRLDRKYIFVDHERNGVFRLVKVE